MRPDLHCNHGGIRSQGQAIDGSSSTIGGTGSFSSWPNNNVDKVFWHKSADVQEVMSATEMLAYNEVTIDELVEQTIRDAIVKRECKRKRARTGNPHFFFSN